MKDFQKTLTDNNVLIIDEDDLAEFNMATGAIKIYKQVFDDFVKDTVIYIHCADIAENTIMSLIMIEEDDDVITMSWLDCFTV